MGSFGRRCGRDRSSRHGRWTSIRRRTSTNRLSRLTRICRLISVIGQTAGSWRDCGSRMKAVRWIGRRLMRRRVRSSWESSWLRLSSCVTVCMMWGWSRSSVRTLWRSSSVALIWRVARRMTIGSRCHASETSAHCFGWHSYNMMTTRRSTRRRGRRVPFLNYMSMPSIRRRRMIHDSMWRSLNCLYGRVSTSCRSVLICWQM